MVDARQSGPYFMKRILLVIAAILSLLVALIVGEAVYESVFAYKHRYRLTIEVEVDGQLRSASSVIEVQFRKKAPWAPAGGGGAGVKLAARGEAVFLDLGGEKHVIAMLESGVMGDERWGAANLALNAFGLQQNWSSDEFWTRVTDLRGRRELLGDLVPPLATFSNLRDPRSGRRIDPKAFSTEFGPGIVLRGAWIEMTSERVTRTIERRLTWLSEMRRREGPVGGRTGQFVVYARLFTR